MGNIEKGLPAKEKRKSEKYRSIPNASSNWGEEVRNNHPDQLHSAILGRIEHIAKRIDTYLPPTSGGENFYKVDQTIATDLENSVVELAESYLKSAREKYFGGKIFPEDENHSYPYDTIKAFDAKLEEIQSLIINAELPLSKEKEHKILINPEAKIDAEKYRELSEDEKNALHEEGISMLKKATEQIKELKEKFESQQLLVESKK